MEIDQHYIEFTFPGVTTPSSAPRALLSLKAAGDMKYTPKEESAARLSLFRSLGIEPERVVGTELRHSRNVAFIERKEDMRRLLGTLSDGEGFDGIVTTNPLLVPSITVADCMPIYVFCEKTGAFGVLHSGWRGTGILKTAVMGMVERYRCDPSEISVIFGPAIGACCYAVDQNRAALFRREFGSASVRELERDGTLQYFIDLLAANIRLAQSLGIIHYAAVHACTCCDDRFSSFRRDGPDHFSRMLALLMCPIPMVAL